MQIGDRVALRPGDRVPVDGVVLEGESAVDEAMLTGESVPADKKSGSELFAGTVNLNGRLVMRVTATGEATALAHIIAAVQRAQTSRADIQRLGDRISNVFVPVIVVRCAGRRIVVGPRAGFGQSCPRISCAIFLARACAGGRGSGFIIAAAVLIVACPCAMGLATPAAIMASANAAARRGILIRDGVALEKAGKVTAVIFDKTGTLTVGKPEVAAVWRSSRREEAQIKGGEPKAENGNESEPPYVGCYEVKLAAALARHSTHPVSQAIAKISAEKFKLSDWKEIRGAALRRNIQHPTSNIQHPMVRLGSLRWLRECGVDLAAGEKFIAEWSAQGATIVGLAAEKNLLGAVRRARRGEAKRGEQSSNNFSGRG